MSLRLHAALSIVALAALVATAVFAAPASSDEAHAWLEGASRFLPLSEQRVTGRIVSPVGTCTPWFDLLHDGIVTRVRYEGCIMPDTVTGCPQSDVTIVGHALGPLFDARLVLGRTTRCGR